MTSEKISRGQWVDIILVLAASVFAWGALMAPGYFLKAHDAPHSVFFLLQFDKALRDGAWYPRWGIDFALGYGYPLFSYYSPGAYYVAELFHLLGASLTDALKITYALATAGSGLAMYGLARRIFGRMPGLLAAVVYMFAPYHLLDLYVRSSFAEYVAFVFLPLVFWAFFNLIESPSLARLALAGLAYAGLILTHNATFLIATPLLAVYCLYLLVRRRRMGADGGELALSTGTAALAALLAFALSASLLLPVVLERGYIAQSQWTQGSFGYNKHFTYPGQVLSPLWGYGYAGEGPSDDMSLQVGVAGLALALVGLASRPTRERGHWRFFLLSTVVLIVLMLPISEPAWRTLPLVGLVQFPWRLLIPTALTLSLSAGAVLTRDNEGRDTVDFQPAVWVLCLMVALASYAHAVPEYTAPDPRSETEKAIIDFETFYPPDRVGMTGWAQQQPRSSPLVKQYLADEPLTRAIALAGNGEVQTLRSGGRSVETRISSDAGCTVQFYVYYFPGWDVYLDGEPVPGRPDGPHGLLTVDVPPGEHRLTIRFGDTPMGSLGKIVSLVALGGCLALLVLGSRPRRLQ